MFNRLLFLLTVALALGPVGLVTLAPGLVQPNPAEQPEWLVLFARDATIRRAAIACALGLIVTACVFFRTAGRTERREERGKRPRSANTIGA
jgi:hypothetical protein